MGEVMDGEDGNQSPVERMLKKMGIHLNQNLIDNLRQQSPNAKGRQRCNTDSIPLPVLENSHSFDHLRSGCDEHVL